MSDEKKYDREQVCEMYRMGFSPKKIAERLGCCTKQVRRIVKLHDVEKGRLRIDKLLDSAYEVIMWQHYYNIHKSYSRTAWLFGVSRQQVRVKLLKRKVKKA